MINPTPEEIRRARRFTGLTLKKSAEICQVDIRTWQRWEAGERKMAPGYWELFQIKTKEK